MALYNKKMRFILILCLFTSALGLGQAHARLESANIGVGLAGTLGGMALGRALAPKPRPENRSAVIITMGHVQYGSEGSGKTQVPKTKEKQNLNDEKELRQELEIWCDIKGTSQIIDLIEWLDGEYQRAGMSGFRLLDDPKEVRSGIRRVMKGKSARAQESVRRRVGRLSRRLSEFANKYGSDHAVQVLNVSKALTLSN